MSITTVTPLDENGDLGEKDDTIIENKAVEYEDRDPNNLNEHLQVMWDDVIGEYEGLRSIDCAWNLSKKCYDATRGGCYICLSLVFGPCLACCAGIHFACLAFQHVWCLGPFLRSYKINGAFIHACCTIGLTSYCAPVMETCGLLLGKIKVKYQRLPDGKEKEDMFYIV